MPPRIFHEMPTSGTNAEYISHAIWKWNCKRKRNVKSEFDCELRTSQLNYRLQLFVPNRTGSLAQLKCVRLVFYLLSIHYRRYLVNSKKIDLVTVSVFDFKIQWATSVWQWHVLATFHKHHSKFSNSKQIYQTVDYISVVDFIEQNLMRSSRSAVKATRNIQDFFLDLLGILRSWGTFFGPKFLNWKKQKFFRTIFQSAIDTHFCFHSDDSHHLPVLYGPM